MTQPHTIDPKILGTLAELVEVSERSKLMNELVGIYVKLAPQILRELTSVALQGDIEAVTHQAHRLKGCSANIGAIQVASLCERLEVAARQGHLLTDQKVFEQLATLLDDTYRDLQQLCLAT